MPPAPCTHRFRRTHPALYLPHVLLALIAKVSLHQILRGQRASEEGFKRETLAAAGASTLLLALAGLDCFLSERKPKKAVLTKVAGILIALGGLCAVNCTHGSMGLKCDLGGVLSTPLDQPAESCSDARNAAFMFGVLAFEWLLTLFVGLKTIRMEKRHQASHATVVDVEFDAEKGEPVTAVTLSEEPKPFCARCFRRTKMHACLLKGASTPRRRAVRAIFAPLVPAVYAAMCGYSVFTLYNIPASFVGVADAPAEAHVLLLSVANLLMASIGEGFVSFSLRKEDPLNGRKSRPGFLKAGRMVLYLMAAGWTAYFWARADKCATRDLFTSAPQGADFAQARTCENAGTTLFFFLLGILVEGSLWRKQVWIRRQLKKAREEQDGGVALPIAENEPLVVAVVKE